MKDNNIQLNTRLNKGVEEIRNITMSPHEKERVFENILHSGTIVEMPVASPYVFRSFIFTVERHKSALYAVVACLVLVICGSGLVSASGNSLPGSILYSLKVNVVEPTHSVLTFSPEEKAKYASSLASKRLAEAEALEDQGNLNSSNAEKLDTLLTDHTKNLNTALNKIYKNQPDENSENEDKIINDFQTEINVHAKVLDTIDTNQGAKKQIEDIKNSKAVRDKVHKDATEVNISSHNEVGEEDHQEDKSKFHE